MGYSIFLRNLLFVGSIVSSAIGLSVDHPKMSSHTLKMYMSRHEGCVGSPRSL